MALDRLQATPVYRAVEAGSDDVDLLGACSDGRRDRDVVGDPAVDVEATADLDGREQARKCRAGQDGVNDWPGVEGDGAAGLEVGGDDAELEGGVLDRRVGQRDIEKPAETVAVVESVASQVRDQVPRPEREPKDVSRANRGPEIGETPDPLEARVTGEVGSVDRAGRRPNEQVGLDASLEKGEHRTDLTCSEIPASGEDERFHDRSLLWCCT